MPFRDQDWEDFQRDCDFFPAYTDYVYGLDTRPGVTDEPGLHPQIYGPPQPRPQRLYGLPQSTQYFAAYDPVRDADRASPDTMQSPKSTETKPPIVAAVSPTVTRALLQMFPMQQPTSLLRHESSLESPLPTPTPAPRTLPTPDPPIPLLRPGELIANPAYSSIPQQERIAANKSIIQAWSIIKSDAIAVQKASATNYIQKVSRLAANKRQEYQDHERIGLEAQEAEAEREALQRSKQQEHQHHDSFAGSKAQSAEDVESQAEGEGLVGHTYAICDMSQLPAYVQSRLSQLWACTQIVALRAPPTNQTQLDLHRQAQQFLIAFKQSVPPRGRWWVDLVVDRMLQLRKQGGDPQTVLETMPTVEETDPLQS
ncbi:uncharacterized protein EKO05_0010404 [Ascochyta rabiei]|uniref:Uncharacterized protein n=1 Tax=Didymella rabiei TaxID=5454 RepID=A0A163MC18_DIDRA|nr:uncharacterized protein EKO05_0010404 [Ascochyta rabiei]KZM18874.1 hypothetical protein ST47_g9980 [Ascochyta rabiei]KZM28581.1 hypothetical protein ST47_g285 [Ascochyta rabiei]UPX20163.1 hypothetical protein EKO05_0010404 [Ascochyta rabiei]